MSAYINVSGQIQRQLQGAYVRFAALIKRGVSNLICVSFVIAGGVTPTSGGGSYSPLSQRRNASDQ
jgi:hypothetical protein